MRSKIRELFDKTGIDIALIRSFPNASDPNFAYFSGLSQKHYNENLMLLERGKKPLVFCSPLEFDSAKKNRQIRAVLLKTRKLFETTVQKKIRRKKAGINFEYYPNLNLKMLRKFKPKKIINIGKALAELRETKTPSELSKIKKACQITEKTLSQIPKIVKIGMTEEKLAFELEILSRKLGAEELAFPTIVAFGKNAATPHHESGPTKIQKGNFLLVDFGVKYQNYCSDVSRTFFVGKPTAKQNWAYWVVRQAQQKAFQTILPEKKAVEPFTIADRLLFSQFKQHLPHALGHGLGIKEHDYPARMGPNENWKFKAGQVLTLEPGIYLKNRFGIRIEDDVLVTKTKCHWLTKSPAKLVQI
ncbi:MAG: Xaa-Pro peptidase family protein [Candidatus Micrarchaeota archaeon]